MTSRDVRLSWAVFALLFVSYAYFYQGGGWNENSRLDLVRAIFDNHTLAIDKYHENTGDKARFGDHYYSDKAPGLSLVAVPVYAIVTLLRAVVSSEHQFVVLASYLVTLLTVGVAGAATGALVFRAGRLFGATPLGSVIAAVGYGLGTIAFPLSTMLFGHQLAALLLFSAFVFAWENKVEPSRWKTVVIPLFLGAAVLVELPTLPAALGLGAYHLGLKPTRRALLLTALAALPLLGLAAYLTATFESPLRVGYDVLADPASRDEMHTRGVFGLTFPRIGVLVELLLGRYRGLLPYSPILLLAAPGFFSAISRDAPTDGAAESVVAERRRAAKVALGVCVYFLLFVSSYAWWQGGSSFGSRHLAPMLPFFAAPVALVAGRRPGLGLALLVPSLAVMLIVTSVQPKPSDRLKNPFWAGMLPAFRNGIVAGNDVCPMIGRIGHAPHQNFLRRARTDAFNLGMVLGGNGPKSLTPLLSLWVVSAWAFARAARRESDEAAPAQTDPGAATGGTH